MIKTIQSENKDEILYQCEICSFHYLEKKQAEKCEAWCREHNSCNLEITASAIENKPK